MRLAVRSPAAQTRSNPTVGASRPPSNAARLLQLQRQVGNAATAVLVARAPAAPVVTPSAGGFKTPAAIDAMTLSQFHDYAQSEAAWASDPALPAADKKALISLLEFARNGALAPLDSCGDQPVHDLLATSLTAEVRADLRTYARGVAASDSAAIPRTAKVADARRDGEALTKLEAAVPKPILHRTMGTDPKGKAQFPALVAAGEVENFATYAKRAHPALEDTDGADIASYLAMVAVDHKNPVAYVGVLPHVKNYHRFLAPMLDTLVSNEADVSKAKPLLLILHSGSDHNGAFHRDAGLQATVQHPRNLTIMVEGAASLDALGADAAAIANRQGQGKKIEQLMLAGHGDSRLIEMAGSQRKDGSYAGDAVDLNANRKRTERFLKGLVGRMVKGPGAHIVLNACLNASDEVNAKLPADPAKARKVILASLKNQPSLAGRLGQIAPGATVEGNVSSVGAGTYLAVDAAGNPTGILHSTVPGDPKATSSDRGEYVEFGVEAEGCVKAVVALWAIDKAECLKRVDARRKQAVGGWGDPIIHMIYDLLAAKPDDIAFINRISNFAVRGLSDFNQAAEQKPEKLAALFNEFTAAEQKKLLAPLHPALDARGKLALDAGWMVRDPTRRASFMAEIDGFATTQEFESHLSAPWLAPSMAALLPAASAGAPSTAQAKLALWGVTGGRRDAAAVAFLKAGATAAGALTMPAGTTVSGLTNGTNEDTVLETIGLKGAAAALPDNPVGNLDLDGDGVNETFVESMTRHGVVVVGSRRMLAAPSLTAAKLEVVGRGTELYVFGRTGQFRAVERPSGGIGFVHQSWIKRVATP